MGSWNNSLTTRLTIPLAPLKTTPAASSRPTTMPIWVMMCSLLRHHHLHLQTLRDWLAASILHILQISHLVHQCLLHPRPRKRVAYIYHRFYFSLETTTF